MKLPVKKTSLCINVKQNNRTTGTWRCIFGTVCRDLGEFGVEPEETSVRKALHEETSVNNLDPCGFNRELN